KLNYFGISYGTELGGVYAHLFPKRTPGRAPRGPTAVGRQSGAAAPRPELPRGLPAGAGGGA
ncbi:hypothetical protein ABT144_37750, partial [Streptomyces sp. NPDC002039]|uniref:hypothetical protein n=1 Tax=Streptomyces sp. NPDC002039 TaxID=3154660 RepID=UPI003327A7BF